jgi:hypothetical protein
MGWWEAKNGVDVLGDGPADILSAALREIEQLAGRRLTLQEVLDNMRWALAVNPKALLWDGEVQVSTLTARLNDGGTVSSSDVARGDETAVRILYQAFEDIVTAYEDMEDHRKPRLSELLATAAFILGPDDQDFVVTPIGRGVYTITANGKLQ